MATALAAVDVVTATNLCFDALISGDGGGDGPRREHRTHEHHLWDSCKVFCFNDKAAMPL
jgi:hypothetical protein